MASRPLAGAVPTGTFVAMVRTRDFLLLLLAFLALGAVICVILRLVLRSWWQREGVRRAAAVLLAVDLAVPGTWFGLMRLGLTDAADSLVTAQLALFFGQIALGGGLILAALLRAAGHLRRTPTPVDNRRRLLLQSVAVAIPVAAGAAGLGGVLESSGPVRVRRKILTFPTLPGALAGLRILHFSDVHLWSLVKIGDLERALARAPRGEYDLVCMTGDLADDVTQLSRALELIDALDAPLGAFACLGNHEHARGLPAALAAYAASPVSLLVAGRRVLHHDGEPFIVAGIDDLRSVPRINQSAFYPDQLQRAFGEMAPDVFSIVLSHRPSVLPYAAAAGADLVLAGHTHGGQMAIAGHSILEFNGVVPWAWGVYERDQCLMHVTCGLGQWFPFRLGCPPEMVILELQPGPMMGSST